MNWHSPDNVPSIKGHVCCAVFLQSFYRQCQRCDVCTVFLQSFYRQRQRCDVCLPTVNISHPLQDYSHRIPLAVFSTSFVLSDVSQKSVIHYSSRKSRHDPQTWAARLQNQYTIPTTPSSCSLYTLRSQYLCAPRNNSWSLLTYLDISFCKTEQ